MKELGEKVPYLIYVVHVELYRVAGLLGFHRYGGEDQTLLPGLWASLVLAIIKCIYLLPTYLHFMQDMKGAYYY
jgi:hypothetical protein